MGTSRDQYKSYSSQYGAGMRKRARAFTLIELLVVIAIIAILAAIILPVFTRAKVSALRNGDIASMNQLRTALGLYRADHGAYPPQLLGYVTLYSTGPQAGNVIPAPSVKGYIYPDQAKSIDAFKPAYTKFNNTQITGTLGTTSGVVFPDGDPTAVGTTGIIDLNGDGSIDGTDDILGARQAYGSGDGDVCWAGAVNGIAAGSLCGNPGSFPVNFYRLSGYDVFDNKTPSGIQTELRYTRFWTNFAIGNGPGFGAGSSFDDPRQLGYNDPPEDTVVTWNSVFRQYDDANQVEPGRHEIVLLLGGSARPMSSQDFANYAWRQRR